jgi:hypothetical protein
MGGCSFLLVRDHKDGNISLVADMENGKLKSLTLSDSKDTVVIRAFDKVNNSLEYQIIKRIIFHICNFSYIFF